MKISEFRNVLLANPGRELQIMLPEGDWVPAHFHITEVGRVQKDFIDCGGTVRCVKSCVLQVWVAEDVDHRLDTSKLARILRAAAAILGPEDSAVEVEYENGTVSIFPVVAAAATPAAVVLQLGSKHAACLAPDRCGLPVLGGPKCC